MATKMDSSIFHPCFSAAQQDEKLFNELINYAKQFLSNPDDMTMRIRIKQFCNEKKIPHPNFPPGRSPVNEKETNNFIPLHIALENENFREWFSSQRVIWHTHNNIQEWHVNCQCRKCQKTHLSCALLRLASADISRIISGSISSRGRFFVFNHRVNKCLETKIAIENGKFQFIQNAPRGFSFGCILTPTDIQVENEK